MIHVPDDGPRTARLVLIGEAPGGHEMRLRRPFVGPSGHLLTEWWRDVGLNRADFYITNVLPFQAPGNKIERVPRADVAYWIDELHKRLAALTDPWLLIPTGDLALRALLGKAGGVLRHRGSIYAYTDLRGRTIKAIPTIHPAATFRTPSWAKRCRADWRRIAADARFRDLRLPEREHYIARTVDDLTNFQMDVMAQPSAVLFGDIETPRKATTQVKLKKDGTPYARQPRVLGARRITTIAFAIDPGFSITVPTTRRHWGSAEALSAVWQWIRTLCDSPHEKGFQNNCFDRWWLARPPYHCPVRNMRWDPLAMHHALDAAESHSLEFLASIYTREPFWKLEGKGDDTGDVEPRDYEGFLIYNGKDACVPLEIVDRLHRELGRLGALDFYDAHYVQMFAPLLQMMSEGIAVSQPVRRRRQAELTAECFGLQDQLAALVRAEVARRGLTPDTLPQWYHHASKTQWLAPAYWGALHAAKDLSNTRLQWFLYDLLRLPKQYAKDSSGARAVTTREVAVRRLQLRYRERVGDAADLILQHRRAAKLASFYSESITDADDRVRCWYKFTTETGRLASAKNPGGTGMNLQNVDREARDMLIADPGTVLLEVDLSQAEARVVDILTGDPWHIERARSLPWERDQHTENTHRIFRADFPTLADLVRLKADDPKEFKRRRYLGKKGKHAGNYGMAGERLSDELLKDGFIYTPQECQRMIDAGLEDPILEWQARTRKELMAFRMLANTWGRVFDAHGERLNDELYRRAYAFVPQSDVADLLNQWGLIPLHAEIARHGWKSRIRLQVHDALVIACPPDEAWPVYDFLRRALERPRCYRGVSLTIPCEAKLGLSWAGGREFGRPPGREEFEAAVAAVVGEAEAETARVA